MDLLDLLKTSGLQFFHNKTNSNQWKLYLHPLEVYSSYLRFTGSNFSINYSRACHRKSLPSFMHSGTTEKGAHIWLGTLKFAAQLTGAPVMPACCTYSSWIAAAGETWVQRIYHLTEVWKLACSLEHIERLPESELSSLSSSNNKISSWLMIKPESDIKQCLEIGAIDAALTFHRLMTLQVSVKLSTAYESWSVL